MRAGLSILTASVFAFLVIFPASAQLASGEAAYTDKPLLVIRYNQPRVYFGDALGRGVISARKVKPDMIFNVVAYVPESVAPKTARLNLRAVVETMLANGVPASQITWKTEPTTGSYQETHVYVE